MFLALRFRFGAASWVYCKVYNGSCMAGLVFTTTISLRSFVSASVAVLVTSSTVLNVKAGIRKSII